MCFYVRNTYTNVLWVYVYIMWLLIACELMVQPYIVCTLDNIHIFISILSYVQYTVGAGL